MCSGCLQVTLNICAEEKPSLGAAINDLVDLIEQGVSGQASKFIVVVIFR